MEFRGENVLVTGGAGFIGSSLVRELLKKGAEIFVYDNFLSGDLHNLEEVKNEIRIIRGDILTENFANLLIKNKIDYLFNLAAEPYIPHCYERPDKFFQINAGGALNVMLACKKAGIKRIMQYSSSEVYGTASYIPMDEEHPLNPASTYAVSKMAADRLCYTLYYEQKLPIIILRQFNTYGPRETHPYIIPELITQLSKTNELKLGNIRARRDLTYVEDAVKGAISLMKCDAAVGQVVNLGSGLDWSIEELANIIAKLMGWDSIEIEVEKERLRPLDVERLQCNYSKAKRLCGWEPKVSLEEGLRKTIDWYGKNGNRWVWETKIASEEEIWHKK